MPGETAIDGVDRPAPLVGGAAAAPSPALRDTIADDVLKPVDPRSVTVERITAWIVTACLALGQAIGAIVAIVSGPPLWIIALIPLVWVTVTGILAWLSERFPRWEYARKRYRLSRLGIEIQKGVWWRRVITVPRSRIQHTDVTQGPLMRRYGVASLVMHTAGTENASVELSGLSYETALALRDYLIRGGEHDGV